MRGKIDYEDLAKNNDEQVLDFLPHYITRCYFGVASECKSEYELLKKYNCIVFTDQEKNFDTTSTIEGTYDIFEMLACGQVSVDNNGKKGYPMISATLPWPCPACQGKTTDSCILYVEREIKKEVLS